MMSWAEIRESLQPMNRYSGCWPDRGRGKDDGEERRTETGRKEGGARK